MFQVKEPIPYDKNKREVMQASKEVSKYITVKPFPTTKRIGKRLFPIFLKAIPSEQRDKYKRDGIPFNYLTKNQSEIQYTLVE
jgi:hypothetical protein